MTSIGVPTASHDQGELHQETLSRSERAPRTVARRVCVLGEDLSAPPDEGLKKMTVAISGALSHNHEVTVISGRGPVTQPNARVIAAPRSFLSPTLAQVLRQARPDALIYAARPSVTLSTFLRCRVLAMYCPSARVAVLGLQTRRHSRLAQRAIPHLAPELVVVQAAESQRYLESLGCTVDLLPAGVDAGRFQPADPARRRQLRERHGLEPEQPVILHVGHLQVGRNVDTLAEIARRGIQAVLAVSSSTSQDEALAARLVQSGVRLLREYVPNIEELYQLADCYIFPVISTIHAIEAPLSVLEALACDLPVVTMRFGGLPRMFAGATSQALRFVDSPGELIDVATHMARQRTPGGRQLVEPYSWEKVANRLLARVLTKDAAQGPGRRPVRDSA